MLEKRVIGKGILAIGLFCMMAATMVMPSAIGEDVGNFYVERHPPGAPSTDIVYHDWTPSSDGVVYLEIRNAGMASVTISIIEDETEVLLAQTIRFQGDGTAILNSGSVDVQAGLKYTFTAIPGGSPGSGGTLYLCFTPVAAPSEVTYTIYDMFGEPWGPWWDYRLASSTWDTERLLSTSTGDVTYLYSLLHNPAGDESDQGLIYAPYRWNVDAVNLPTMDVHDPVIMPTAGSDQVGAAVTMGVHFQYLYLGVDGEWTEVWIPEWATSGDFATVSEETVKPTSWLTSVATTHLAYNDGYMTGALMEVTMNRAAAEEWMGMPQTGDPITWWDSNGAGYLADWEAWISDQGNEVFDIYCGYEWPYVPLGTIMKLGVDGDDVVLEIGHVSWGYEALITRWMEYADVSMHQPYMEDFTMTATYGESGTDLTYNAVAQWSLHCVKQNDVAAGDNAPCAWVWEPIALDYIESWQAHPDSDYDPYASLEYTSWNCGDVGYGTLVSYEGTPVEFDLAIGRTLVVILPTDTVTGYYAEPVPVDAIWQVWDGNLEDYMAIQYEGTMSFGFLDIGGADYQIVDNVLTITGPADFENPYPTDPDALLHGAPWLEFNVVPPA